MTMAPSHPGNRTPQVPTTDPSDPSRPGVAVPAPPSTRLPALAAAVTGAASILYAVGYLVVAPSAQRGSDAGVALRSLAGDPWGMRIAAGCLVAAGLTSGLALTGLRHRLGRPADGVLAWATVAAVAGGLASAAHGLGEIVALERLADRYLEGDAATRAAAELTKAMPSAVDPLGLATFGLAGLVTLVFAQRLRPAAPRLATVGLAYGALLLALFVANAAGVDDAVLVTGGLASLVAGPVWWLGLARHLLPGLVSDAQPAPGPAREPAAGPHVVPTLGSGTGG